MGDYYGDGFEDFHKQVVFMFTDLDFSQMQIKLTAPMTPAIEPTPDDVETNEEVLVIDEPSGVTDEPVDPQEQTNNPITDP